ncbi:unnamed protein product [Gulo gulo]|uniref:60S ribosomal protein L31 n=1 Tax=Gulo gulo TaxID=48420 RepID=A0A9X9LFJ6_GULGU|nr:unnamed protein product [Gulo gulo]
MGTPEVNFYTRFNKAVWVKGVRNIPYCVHVWLSRKYKEDEDSPKKLYTLIPYVPITTFKNLQLMWMRTNRCLSNKGIKLQNRQTKKKPKTPNS